jgi:hypothetical protein
MPLRVSLAFVGYIFISRKMAAARSCELQATPAPLLAWATSVRQLTVPVVGPKCNFFTVIFPEYKITTWLRAS